MARRAYAAFLCSGILAGAAPVAWADSPGPAPWLYDRTATARQEIGQFFAGFTFNAEVQHRPRFNTNVTVFEVGVRPVLPGSFSQDILGYQPGGEIGYVFRDGTLPAWAGARVRASLYGSAYFATAKTGTSTPSIAGYALTGVNVNGAMVLGGFSVSPGSFEETLKVQREHYRLGIKIESDFALTPDVSLTPSLGFFGGRQHDAYEYDFRRPTPVFNVASGAASLNERLRTTEYGGFVGARLAWQFRPGWALDFGGTAGAVALSSRLQAASCVAPALIIPANGACQTGLAASSATATASDSALGFRGTASIGLTADMRYALVSLGGHMRYDSHLPGIRNPQVDTPTAGSPGPVKIKYAGGFAYGGHLTVRLRLP